GQPCQRPSHPQRLHVFVVVPEAKAVDPLTAHSHRSRYRDKIVGPVVRQSRAHSTRACVHSKPGALRIWLCLNLSRRFVCAHLPRLSHLSESVCRVICDRVPARSTVEGVSIARRENGSALHLLFLQPPVRAV